MDPKYRYRSDNQGIRSTMLIIPLHSRKCDLLKVCKTLIQMITFIVLLTRYSAGKGQGGLRHLCCMLGRAGVCQLYPNVWDVRSSLHHVRASCPLDYISSPESLDMYKSVLSVRAQADLAKVAFASAHITQLRRIAFRSRYVYV